MTDTQTQEKIVAIIATEIAAQAQQVRAAAQLLDAGATVPFIARYRKEVTGGLDDQQLRVLQERRLYLCELEERRSAILKSIDEQGKLTPALADAIQAAATKQTLEDLYLPYKPKRRSKGLIAREAGLEPLADALLADPDLDPQIAAAPYVLSPEQSPKGGDFSSVAAVLDGVRDVLAERWAEDAALVQNMRTWLWHEALLISQRSASADENSPEVLRFRDYFDYAEPIKTVPSHRALAVFRGRSLNFLDVKLEHPGADRGLAEGRIAQHVGWSFQNRTADTLLRKCVQWAWKVKLALALERDMFAQLREAAEKVAIDVFAQNLRHLLLAAPAGKRVVMGLDPGIRTGVKVAVVSDTGKLLDTATVYPHEPRRDWQGALYTLAQLCDRHAVSLITIGNGTASRQTDQLVSELVQGLAQTGRSIAKLVVSEAGASVYSASAYASKELPDVDVSLRGAVSIARRVQDPLAELVKIEPKSIGVGQYQHDVSQSDLARSLDAVVEDCVNAVGVNVNTASEPLLARVSGLSNSTARAIVAHRNSHGAFANRTTLLQVAGLGPRTFEQSAGFLRILEGDNPLDMTGVHPESYPIVELMLQQTGKSVPELMGKVDILRSIKPQSLVERGFGLMTVQDIVKELEKPGRDPRPDFKVAKLQNGVNALPDLRVGMILEGTVTNVAAFGAFVDIGVHQDGLVHVSQVSAKFVRDASAVLKAGDIVKVRVLDIDAARKRIALSLRLDASPGPSASPRQDRAAAASQHRGRDQTPAATAMADAFAKLRR